MGVEELNLDWGQFTGHVTINVNIRTDHDAPILLLIYDGEGKTILHDYYKQTLIHIPISVLYQGTFRYEAFVNGELVKRGTLLI
jgi:hypothetical protein